LPDKQYDIVFRNIVLTVLLIVAIVIAAELARPGPAPPPLDDRAENEFASARKVLERRISELNLHGITVQQSLELVHRQTGVPIEVNWNSLENVRDRQVDIELRDVAIGDLLQFLFCLDRYDQAFYPLQQPEFDVIHGTIVVGKSVFNDSRTFPVGALTLRSYDVRDLLTDEYWGYESGPKPAKVGDARLGELSWLVQNLAGMKNYEVQAGTHGQEPSGTACIYAMAGRLFVVQTAYGHLQVEDFLARLRAAGRVQPESR
jgi:hypothetical protein